jgi:hypothetical protein
MITRLLRLLLLGWGFLMLGVAMVVIAMARCLARLRSRPVSPSRSSEEK